MLNTLFPDQAKGGQGTVATGKRLLIVVVASVLWLPSGVPFASPGENPLKDHPSPYLAMHGEDPVQWKLWDTVALAEARRADKLLLVSVGYYACHWCHVIHQESYQNESIAAVLNANFVSIKVDRELEPALDRYLMTFVKATLGYAGWPLQVFLTPEGYPLVGTTYLPAEDFLAFLERLHGRWARHKTSLRRTAEAAFRQISIRQAESWTYPVNAQAVVHYRQRFLEEMLDRADTLRGGFGDTSKFPAVPQLRGLLAVYRLAPSAELAEVLRLSLHQINTQGLRDHLGGGYFRYAIDPDWRVPHFEKMLYDNALLATLYFDAAETFADAEFEAAGRSTLDFMLRELQEAQGAFIASLAANNGSGVEGGYYLWDEAMLEKTLTPEERAVARLAWELRGSASLEGGYLPAQGTPLTAIASLLDIPRGKAEELRDTARAKLLSARNRREMPRDEKVIGAWNALVLRALVEGAKLEGGSKYRRAAVRLRNYVVKNLWNGQWLQRARSFGKTLGKGALEDYAYLADGLLAYAQLTNSRADTLLTRQLLAVARQKFYGGEGWALAESTLLPRPLFEPVIADGPMPSPSAVTLQTALRTAAALDDDTLRNQTCAVLRKHGPASEVDLYHYATHVVVLLESFGRNTMERSQPPVTGGKKATSSPSFTC